jgi:dihydroorotate dehydrogenase (NAD+) catalytic subunit
LVFDIPTKFAGIELNNPIIVASGILGLSQSIFKRLEKIGVGAIVSKSISIKPRDGYRNPTIVALGNNNWLNAVGLANPGAEAFAKEIANNSVPLFVSLVGSNVSEYIQIVEKIKNHNILGFELNLSCPHVEKMGMEIGDDPKLVSDIIRSIKTKTSKPLFVKVGIGKTDVIHIAKTAENSGADGVTAINTIRAMKIDITNRCPILENKIGGLSGIALKSIGVRCVYELYKSIKIPIIGCGGIQNYEDVIEYVMAGATAVQVGSMIGTYGINSIQRLAKDLKVYLEAKKYDSLRELIGVAHR